MAAATGSATKASAAGGGGAKTGYLALYNFASAVLWTAVLGRTAVAAAAVLLSSGPALVRVDVEAFARWTQTLAGLEVLHSVFGTAEPAGAHSPSRSRTLTLAWHMES